MIHDPLCPYPDPEYLPDECHHCRLIARVREDERQTREITYVWDQGEVDALRKQGYAAGVRDARDAVAARREAAKLDYSGPYLLGMADAIDAIDALRGESNG